jgi:thiamine biosynthesis lipoprotein
MKLQLHTGSRTVTIGADFLVWDMPCRVVLTDPWQLREAREVLRAELTDLDRAARLARRRRGKVAHKQAPTGRFPYGVTTAPANGAVHHSVAAFDGLETGRGRRRPIHLDPAPSVTAIAVQRCAEAVAEAARCGVLVAIGGDLAVSGLAPAGGWRIALPTASDTVPTVLAIDGGALCTVGLPTRGQLRKLVVTATARPVEPVWRHLVVLGATAPAANAATSGALLRGPGAGPWLAAGGLGARLVDGQGRSQEVGCWPDRTATPVGPA